MAYKLADNPEQSGSGFDIADPDRPMNVGSFPRSEPSIKYLQPDQVDWLAKRINPLTAGCAVDPATVARAMACKTIPRAIDVDRTLATLVVSQRVCDVIERFEPGVHQFLPVDIYRKGYKPGDAPVVRLHWLIVGQWFDAVSAEHTRYARAKTIHPDGTVEPGIWDFYGNLTGEPKGEGPLVFDRQAIGSRHLWIDRNTGDHYPFVSDDLGKALIAMDLYGARFEYYDEV
jgi:hypothetical protein